MNTGKNKVLKLIGGGAVVGAIAIGMFVSQRSANVPAGSVQGAIGERTVYRDSATTGAAVDANSTKEFEKLYRIGRFKTLANDPNFKMLAADASFLELIENNDFQALMASADFMAAVKSGDLQRLAGGALALERGRRSLNLERRPTEAMLVEKKFAGDALALERLKGSQEFMRLLEAKKFEAIFQSDAFMKLALEKSFVESMATMRAARR